jgi:type IV pilus assembly protein PilO
MQFGPRSLTLLGTLVALPLASWWFVFRPQNKQMHIDKEDIAHMKEMLEKLKAETAKTDDLAKANDEIRKSIQIIETKLPSGKEIDSVVRQVSDVAVNAGLGAPALKSGLPVAASLYMEQPLEMSVAGSFGGFYAFLRNLESLPRLTRLPELKIQSVERQDGVSMQAEFTLSIYFQQEGTPTP